MAGPTAQYLIEAAMGQRTANDPLRLYSGPEMIGELDRYLLWLYTWVAERNKYFFGKALAVDPATSAWAKPSDAIIVWLAESGGAFGTGTSRVVTPTGTEISIVRYEERLKSALAPRVYELGNSFISVGESGDPSATANGDKITFLYARRHARLDSTLATTHATNTLEDAWPVQYNRLPILALARFLARKDGRKAEEIQDLITEHDAVLSTFEMELRNAQAGAIGRFSRNPAPVS